MSEGIKAHLFKIQVGSAIAAVFFIITTTACFIGAKKDVDARLDSVETEYDHAHKWYLALDLKQKQIDEDNQQQDLILVEINTKLTNIETILIELKQSRL